jgi:hypothetical protein
MNFIYPGKKENQKSDDELLKEFRQSGELEALG